MKTPDKILFITLSCLGDAVLTTPALEALHDAYPKASFDIVAHPRCIQIFQQFPYVNELHHKGAECSLRDYIQLLLKLRKTYYDLIVDLRTDGYSLLLRGNKRIFKPSNQRTRAIHAAQKHFSAIRTLVTSPAPPSAKIYLDAALRDYAHETLCLPSHKKILAIGCGGSIKNQWPTDNYVNLVKLLSPEFDQIILLGNEEQTKLSYSITGDSQQKIINMVGKTTLLQAAALLEQSTIFVGTDSGLGHLASAVNCRTLSIFGPDNPDRCCPWGAKSVWLQGVNKVTSDITPQHVYEFLKATLF